MTGRLLRLDVENFRTLRKVSVPLGPLTVLVGPNGVGKSNVLKVFDFLTDIIQTDLEPALEARGGFDEVAFWGGGKRPPTTMSIGLQALWTTHASPSAPDEYELTIRRRAVPGRPDGAYTLSRSEKFQFKRTRGRGRRIAISGEQATVVETHATEDAEESQFGIQRLSSGLSTLPRLARTEGGAEVSRVAERLSSFRVFDVDVRAARRPSRVATMGQHLEPDAGNLADFLLDLREQDVQNWQRLLEDVKTVLPHLEDIEFGSAGSAIDEVTVYLRERGLRRGTPLADASFGTVRLLGLLALLYDPNPPALTCVEEIDHGLHPQALELLVDRLREASTRSQFLVATHSPALVDRLRPEEFVVCERDRLGASVIPAISTEQIRAIVEESEDLPLGELWFSGALGGDL
ncbi:AAA family ATPase [Allostreptomyces psammosilenae]|uniref:Putative ATPase n=1 Tax=Allostreptomyces psammosilenae TaxID=1892865 RepID=A0A852ZP52_9ACTN|nr:AAA family ATPase [Allostreptomyces psammosilenae]NYI03495.1 putative ATPase [Allostreptomyces psammosilenae]